MYNTTDQNRQPMKATSTIEHIKPDGGVIVHKCDDFNADAIAKTLELAEGASSICLRKQQVWLIDLPADDLEEQLRDFLK